MYKRPTSSNLLSLSAEVVRPVQFTSCYLPEKRARHAITSLDALNTTRVIDTGINKSLYEPNSPQPYKMSLPHQTTQ